LKITFIEPSFSSWSSPGGTFSKKKKKKKKKKMVTNGDWGVDYRKLNNFTI